MSASHEQRRHRPDQQRGVAGDRSWPERRVPSAAVAASDRGVGRAEGDADRAHHASRQHRADDHQRPGSPARGDGSRSADHERRPGRTGDGRHEDVEAGAGEVAAQRGVVGVVDWCCWTTLGGRASRATPRPRRRARPPRRRRQHRDRERQAVRRSAHRRTDRRRSPRSSAQAPRAQQLLEVGEQRRARRRPAAGRRAASRWSGSRVSSRSCTSVTPGWVPSTSLSCSTTGGGAPGRRQADHHRARTGRRRGRGR